jgi:glycosyltransferase involved in cell wall biosynthesis
MNINIFLLCYNEAALLPHTIRHYKKYLPSCKITIYDNESTDKSVIIAQDMGCDVVSWGSNNSINDFQYQTIKNSCWKGVESGWIIMADMDEFLCVTEDVLYEEMRSGTSVLHIDGKEMIGESATLDLTDIDLQTLTKCIDNHSESKNLCFLREKITDMNYELGAHTCDPVGYVRYSEKRYINKHMSQLGLNFIIDKNIKRYERAAEMRRYGTTFHYMDNVEAIRQSYYAALSRATELT